VFVGLDDTLSKEMKELGEECGVTFDEQGRKVIDHFTSLKESRDDTLFVTSSISPLSSIFSPSSLKVGKILYEGIAHKTEASKSKLNLNLLTASSSSFSFFPAKEISQNTNISIAGKETVLVSALQARNKARVVFCGSIKMLSDSFFAQTDNKGNKFANQLFTHDLLQWTFQLKSVLRVSNLNHHRVSESHPPLFYLIRENVTYSIKIEELKDEKWIPYQADDVQLEFQMLDPHVRFILENDKSGLYSKTFQLPDVYGVFTFRLDYEKKDSPFFMNELSFPLDLSDITNMIVLLLLLILIMPALSPCWEELSYFLSFFFLLEINQRYAIL